MIVLFFPYRSGVDPEHRDYICPLTIEDAAARGSIRTEVQHAGTWTAHDLTHRGTVAEYQESVSSLITYYRDLALSCGHTAPVKYMAAHGSRVLKQPLWFWALRNRAQVDPHLDPMRVQLLELFDFFYRQTVVTMSERESFGSRTVKQMTGFSSVPHLARVLVEEEIYV